MTTRRSRKRTSGLLLASVLLLTCLLASCSSVRLPDTSLRAGQELTLFSATDLHFLPESLGSSEATLEAAIADGDGKMIHYSEPLLTAFAAEIAAAKPDVLLLTGDLTFNGEKAGHAALATKLAALENQTQTRVYVIPGNHDILNPLAQGYAEQGTYPVDSVSAAEFSTIYDAFGYGEAISRDPDSLSYLAAPAEDLWLLMLDTNIYEFNGLLGQSFANGEVKESSLQWIKDCLAKARRSNARVISATHHSLIPNESHRSQGYALDNAAEVRAALDGMVTLNLSGHIHVQDIRQDGHLFDISNGAFSVYPVQYGVITLNPASGFTYQSKVLDVDSWALASGSSDPSLLNFSAWSHDYFAANQAAKARKSLADQGASLYFSPEEITQMANFVGEVNAAYFGGTLDPALARKLMDSSAYALWQKAPENVTFTGFLARIFNEASSGTSRVASKTSAVIPFAG